MCWVLPGHPRLYIYNTSTIHTHVQLESGCCSTEDEAREACRQLAAKLGRCTRGRCAVFLGWVMWPVCCIFVFGHSVAVSCYTTTPPPPTTCLHTLPHKKTHPHHTAAPMHAPSLTLPLTLKYTRNTSINNKQTLMQRPRTPRSPVALCCCQRRMTGSCSVRSSRAART